MDGPKLSAFRKLVNAHESLVYAAVKAAAIDDLPHESLLFAKVVQEHMHLKHVQNALEFADLRDGTSYHLQRRPRQSLYPPCPPRRR
jgi:hypothetical protein